MGFHITYQVDQRTVGRPRRPIADPFVRATVHLDWPTLLRGLLRGRLDVTVTVSADRATRDTVHAVTGQHPGEDELVAAARRVRELEALAEQARVRRDELLDAEFTRLAADLDPQT